MFTAWLGVSIGVFIVCTLMFVIIGSISIGMMDEEDKRILRFLGLGAALSWAWPVAVALLPFGLIWLVVKICKEMSDD